MKYQVVVSKGMFSSVYEASVGEEKVNWFTRSGASECIECFLATDLKNTLEKIKGDRVEISDINDFSFEDENIKTIVFIGKKTSSILANKYNIPYSLPEISAGGAYLKGISYKKKNIVFLSGIDDEGTRNAVMLYMERLGLSFISCEENGTYYNKSKDLKNENEFEIISNPSYVARGAFSRFIKYTNSDFFMWLFHNKMNLIHIDHLDKPEFLKKLCLKISDGDSDIWYKYMDVNHEYPYCHEIFGGEGKPKDPYPVSPLFDARSMNSDYPLTYGKAHPEWYAQVDGKRLGFRNYDEAEKISHYTGDYICTSNKEGTDELVRLIVESFISGEWKYVDYFNFRPLDNGTWCNCENCSKDKVLSYRQLMLAYKLDKAVKKAQEEGKIKRDIKIIIPAYRETLTAPDKPLPEDFDYNTILVNIFLPERCYAHNINDSVCAETNKTLVENMKPWIDGYYKGFLMISEYYNASTFANMPFVFTKRMPADILYYYKKGSRHINYVHFTSKNWGIFAINNYMFSKLLWDVNSDCNEISEDYFTSRYGIFKDEMRELYNELEMVTANCKYWKHYQFINGKKRSLSLDISRERDDIMNCNHIHLLDRADSREGGLSFAEVKEEYEKIYERFMLIYKKLRNKNLYLNDTEQLTYGLNTIGFLYYMASYVVEYNWEIKREIFGHIEDYAKKLSKTLIPLEGYEGNPLFTDGLTASNLYESYIKFKTEIEGINKNNNKNSKAHRCPANIDYYKVSNAYNRRDRGVRTPHWHNEYEFLLFVDGEATQMVNSKNYKVKKGDITLLSPADYHLLLYDKDQFISYKLLPFKSAFYNKYIKGIFKIDELPCIISLDDKTYDKLIELFDIFSNEYKKPKTKRTDLICIRCIVGIMSLIAKEKDKNIIERDYVDPVKMAMTYIQKKFKNDISVKSIANEVQYSQNHLSILFIKTLGISCKNYLNDVRLDYAYNLIVHSDVPMKTACFESGFNSLAYFSNAFKAKYGSSPKQLVAEIKEKQKRNNLRGDIN